MESGRSPRGRCGALPRVRISSVCLPAFSAPVRISTARVARRGNCRRGCIPSRNRSRQCRRSILSCHPLCRKSSRLILIGAGRPAFQNHGCLGYAARRDIECRRKNRGISILRKAGHTDEISVEGGKRAQLEESGLLQKQWDTAFEDVHREQDRELVGLDAQSVAPVRTSGTTMWSV